MSALTKQQQLRLEEAVGLLVRPAPTETREDAAAERTSNLLTHKVSEIQVCKHSEASAQCSHSHADTRTNELFSLWVEEQV